MVGNREREREIVDPFVRRFFLSLALSEVMIINARFLGLCQVHKGMRWGVGLVGFGVGRVVGRRRMPECMTEP